MLLRARERVMEPIRDMLVDAGVTEQQWRVLRVLDEVGPTDPTRISAAAALLMPSLTRILHKLEDKGLIARQSDPGDRRRQIVWITPPGAALIADNREASIALTRTVEGKLGAENYEHLLDLLNRLSALNLMDNKHVEKDGAGNAGKRAHKK